jgi:Tol biopolymer transport system component
MAANASWSGSKWTLRYCSCGTLSPDGSRIAATQRLPHNVRIRVIDLSTKGLHELSINWANLDSIGWSPDRQALFVTSYSSRGEALVRVTLDGTARVLHRFSAWFERPYPSPHGHYLAFGQLQYDCNVWMIENFR